jgi:hypothetical protein
VATDGNNMTREENGPAFVASDSFAMVSALQALGSMWAIALITLSLFFVWLLRKK